ncbi:MAG: glycogen debranching enzyme family protein [Oscillospiraceae bacterium]|nr:glycogen debranching enzyme family protein [Oscillospiraceae bacterium]
MMFTYGKQELRSLDRGQAHCFLLTNGLGGYASLTAAWSAPRADQGLLVAAVKAPNERIVLVHRLRETLQIGQTRCCLSSQSFADGSAPEEGWRHLSLFTCDGAPCWTYHVGGVQLTRRCAMAFEENTVAVQYELDNRSGRPCTLELTPLLKFAPKEAALEAPVDLDFDGNAVRGAGHTLYIHTDAALTATAPRRETLAYTEDAKDGRPAAGMAGACCAATVRVEPGQTRRFALVFSTEPETASAEAIFEAQARRRAQLAEGGHFTDPLARQLVLAADAFIARRDSTGGKTILAGYPLFSDWGRDTMIALPGCTLATGRYEDAKSILRTFLAYEKDGLVPNLFPEGEAQPMYNTVDAALLLIDCVWQYVRRTGDLDFAREAWPVMERIIRCYRQGTRHAIAMDADGLISAGGGLDQVTWMDVCVNGILPTPRHGKPVEINAYWYNALCIMDLLAGELGADKGDYAALAERVRASFVEKFYMEDRGYLRDVLSGTPADEQLRCNQIWAVSMPFTMLSPAQERSVVEAVTRQLYTPCGLRTLAPTDPEYHPHYGGPQVERDMAYHQGTTWVFPLGAYYRARLKVEGPAAAPGIRAQLAALAPMLREGCCGQLPEIYEGDFPAESKGCFAQAWSVGELLRVFEALREQRG